MIQLQASYPYDVSIIVVSFNTQALLRDCLDSLFTECERMEPAIRSEILVVDNASIDGSADMVELPTAANRSNSPDEEGSGRCQRVQNHLWFYRVVRFGTYTGPNAHL